MDFLKQNFYLKWKAPPIVAQNNNSKLPLVKIKVVHYVKARVTEGDIGRNSKENTIVLKKSRSIYKAS